MALGGRIAYDSHRIARGFCHEPGVALHHFAKISGALLAVWVALLACCFCPERAAVRAVCNCLEKGYLFDSRR